MKFRLIAITLAVFVLLSISVSAFDEPKTYYIDENVVYKHSGNYHYYEYYSNSQYRKGYADGYSDGYNYRKPARYDTGNFNKDASYQKPRYIRYVERAGRRSYNTYRKVSGNYPSVRYVSSSYKYAPGYRVRIY